MYKSLSGEVEYLIYFRVSRENDFNRCRDPFTNRSITLESAKALTMEPDQLSSLWNKGHESRDSTPKSAAEF